MLKFSKNPKIYCHLEFIEKKISQLLEFNSNQRVQNDPFLCPFNQYKIYLDDPKDQLLTGEALNIIIKEIKKEWNQRERILVKLNSKINVAIHDE